MKCREKKEIALVASGIILGATIAAPTTGAVLTAEQSSQKIVVDGKPVQIEAYSINGNNYCKLRDVGKPKEHLLELINIHDELVGTMTYDSFREGFVLGARLIMEVVGEQAQNDT